MSARQAVWVVGTGRFRSSHTDDSEYSRFGAAWLIFSRRASDHTTHCSGTFTGYAYRSESSFGNSVVCSGISLCAWHSTGVSDSLRPTSRVRRPSPSSLCRHDYAAGAADSSGNLATAPFRWQRRGRGTVCQNRSGPPRRCCLFGGKGPSVSAVVQLTSDCCLPSFFNLICKTPCNFSKVSL